VLLCVQHEDSSITSRVYDLGGDGFLGEAFTDENVGGDLSIPALLTSTSTLMNFP
jgi:hypothetical protein